MKRRALATSRRLAAVRALARLRRHPSGDVASGRLTVCVARGGLGAAAPNLPHGRRSGSRSGCRQPFVSGSRDHLRFRFLFKTAGPSRQAAAAVARRAGARRACRPAEGWSRGPPRQVGDGHRQARAWVPVCGLDHARTPHPWPNGHQGVPFASACAPPPPPPSPASGSAAPATMAPPLRRAMASSGTEPVWGLSAAACLLTWFQRFFCLRCVCMGELACGWRRGVQEGVGGGSGDAVTVPYLIKTSVKPGQSPAS